MAIAIQEILQDKVNNILGLSGRDIVNLRPTFQGTDIFSEFIPADMKRAKELTQEMGSIADDTGGEEGLRRALDFIESHQNSGDEKPGLCQYALKRFILHYPGARTFLRMPALEKRQPNLAVPSNS